MSGELPEGWAESPMGEVAAIRGGIQKQPKRAPRDNAYPYLRVANVLRGRLDLGQIERMELFGDEPELYRLRSGDLLVVEGNGSLTEIGRSAIWRDEIPTCVHQNHIIRVRSRTCSPEFLDYFWNSPAGIEQISAAAVTTSGLYSLSTKKVAGVVVPMAPLAEQGRIVAAVEALLEQVNRAKERLDRVPHILKRFRQAVLAAACSGRLTEEWRAVHDQTADLPVKAIGFEPVVGEEAPNADIPESWRWVHTESLCDPARAITYGVIKLGAPVEGGVPTLRSSDVRPLFIDGTAIKSISPEIAAQYTRTFLKGGEVLVTVRGTLGGIAVVPPRMAGFNISREVAVLPLRRPVDPDYVAFAVANITSQNWLGERAKGVAYTGINIEDLRLLPLPIPSPEEQAEIVRQVQRLLALADSIERRLQAATARAVKLPQAILSKAFSGELVPTEADLARAEGRTYETAEEMLARVGRESEPNAPVRAASQKGQRRGPKRRRA